MSKKKEPERIKLLVCPPEDWKNAKSIPPNTQDTLKAVAQALGLTYRETTNKVYIGLSDRELVEARPPVLEEPKKIKSPYYSQRDSKVPGQWYRSCFSSCNAMLLETLLPGTLMGGKNADDQYLRTVLKYGDTTDPNAQIKALKHYGLKAVRRQDLSWDFLDNKLASGVPVPIGILQAGPIHAPRGGGHWIFVKEKVGAHHYKVHDPYGELDLVRGRYIHSNGKDRVYSKKNLGRRWLIEGPNSGWGMVVTK